MDLSGWCLRENSAKRSCTSYSRPAASEWTDAAKDTPPQTAPPAGKADDGAQNDYDLPIPYRKALPDNYENDNDDDEDKKTKDKVAPRTLHPRPLFPTVRQMIFPRWIDTNPSLHEKRFKTTLNATTTMTTNTKKLREGTSWA